MGYICKYLELQDVPRDMRMTRNDVGTCRGTKVHIIDGSIYQLIGEVKWDNTWLIIKKWFQRVASEEPLDYKEFRSDW